VEGFDLASSALPDGLLGPVALSRLLVPEAELRWAGWGAPLQLRARGVRVEVLQRQAPTVRERPGGGAMGGMLFRM
jgi:hypothetical protein